MRIVFFGTPTFAASILEFLLKQSVEIAAIVTRPDKPVGRSSALQPTSVKKLAQSLAPHIPIFQPLKASAPDFAQILKTFNADLFVVVAYSEIIKQNLLEMPRYGCINVHASLLPKYRGAAPIQRCIMNGEKQTGITIINMVKELDAGDMLEIASLAIPEDMNAGELSQKLCELAKPTLWKAMQKIENGSLQPKPQDHSLVTFAPKVTSEDGHIDWSKDASEIHNLIRGLTPKPGAWTTLAIKGQPKRLLIKKARIYSADIPYKEPGSLITAEGFVVACQNSFLELLEVQLDGKQSTTSRDFLRGNLKENLLIIP